MRIRYVLGAAGAAALLMPALAQAQPACDSHAQTQTTTAAKPDLRCVQQRQWKRDRAGYYAGMGDFRPGSPREYDQNHVQGGHYDANGVGPTANRSATGTATAPGMRAIFPATSTPAADGSPAAIPSRTEASLNRAAAPA